MECLTSYLEKTDIRIRCARYVMRLRKDRKTKKEYIRRRRMTDIAFRIERTMRSRLSNAIGGSRKSASTMGLVGCTTEELKKYLEGKFTHGMSWENYGLHGWHIDHIKPCSSFDLTDPEQQKACFHYTNLQPLWAVENWRKSDNI